MNPLPGAVSSLWPSILGSFVRLSGFISIVQLATANSDLPGVLRRLERWGAKRAWIGPDPYEGLNTPLGRVAPTRRARQATIQLFKRSPVQPPWPLRARHAPNAKTLALALAGYATPAGGVLRGADEWLDHIPPILERLDLGTHGSAWGYHFDVVTRNISYGRSTPNAIATCFVVEGLLDAHRATGRDRLAELARAARPFLLSLLRRDPEHGPYFAYVPAGSPLIHNANLLVCGALARLDAIEPHPEAAQAVADAAGTTIALQRDDGLWPYGETPNYGWIDNFHTAYTLDGLRHVEAAFGVGATAFARGVAAWRRAFIGPDGWARYFPDRRFPLEAHCYASAIDLLCAPAGHPERPEDTDLARRVADGAVRELWVPEADRFAFKRTARGLNRRAFVRWTNAPMFRALARLLSSQPASTS